MPNLADEIYARINCFGLGSWLDHVCSHLGISLPVPVLPPGVRREFPGPGLVLTLRAEAPAPTQTDMRDALVLQRAVFDGSGEVPLGLDMAGQRPDSARTALSNDAVGGSTAADRRISYFMPEARVVELTFLPGFVGLERIVLARLGAPLDWRRSQSAP